jgi:MFS family permease
MHTGRRRNVVLLSLAFASVGMMWGAQQAAYAELQRDYGLDEATLGLLLLLPPLVGTPTALASPRIIARIGSPALIGFGALTAGCALLLLAFTDAGPTPWAAMVILGVGASSVDVGVLTSGSRVQSDGGSPVLGRIQAVLVVGLVAGGGIGVAVAALGFSYRVSFAVVALLVLLACGGAARLLDLPPGVDLSGRSLSIRAVLGLAGVPVLVMLAFGGFFLEGSVTSFAAVLLRNELGAAAVVASAAAFVVTIGLAVGAYTADASVVRFGARRTMALGAAIATVGVGVAAAVTAPALAVAGLGIAAIGFGGIGPAALTMAAPIDHHHGGAVLPTVSALAYLAFLFGPVVTGQIGQALGLRVAFAILAAGACVLAITALVALRPRAVAE